MRVIVHDMETIIVLVLLAFNFIPQRSHHSLRSWLRDSATATLRPGDGTTAIKVESSANRSAYSPKLKRAPRYRRNNNGPKTLPCSTHDSILTSLLLQPSTMVCCERYDSNCVQCVNIDNTQPPIPTEQSL